ncbi:MAG: hypothetical protein IPK82_37845 [Polyangiaceae bacterium]|nr:hypothetical protein [Polyangiaceae bacterium]
MARVVHLQLLGPHTRVSASLCTSCPSGPAGCCAAPPGLSWADIGRIASLGHTHWLLDEMRTGRLRKGPRGLIIQRIPDTLVAAKCVYHAENSGCTVTSDKRSAACNYYVCGDALLDATGDVVAAEAACAAWMAQYADWDEILSAEVGGWPVRPDIPEEDEALFEHLGKRFSALSKRINAKSFHG